MAEALLCHYYLFINLRLDKKPALAADAAELRHRALAAAAKRDNVAR